MDLIANSPRYILGPVSLERYFPGVPPSIAAFSIGAEAQLGRYSTPKGEMAVAIFNYPNPSIARERQPANRMRSPSCPPLASHSWAYVWRKRWGQTLPSPACSAR